MHPADMPHLRWLEGHTRFLRFCAEPRTGGPITLAWKLNSIGTKVIGALRKVSQRSSGEALSLLTKFFSQLNLSWLTSIMVPPERRTRKQFLPIAYFMANFAGNFLLWYEAWTCAREKSSQRRFEEKNFTNRIFHGELRRGLAIHTQLSSLCLQLDCKVRL